MHKLIYLLAITFFYNGCDNDLATSNSPHTDRYEQTQEVQAPIISNTKTVFISDINGTLKMTFSADSDLSGIEDIKHFQIYLDVDIDASTGFSDEAIVYNDSTYEIIGADYMIEDDKLYKSISKTMWKWDYVSGIVTNNKDIMQNSRTAIYKREYIFPSSLLSGLSSDIRVSIEPLNINYKDTNNFVPTETITIN